MQLFQLMCESLHCRGKEWSVYGGWFPDFLEDNWQTNGCLPLRIDCVVLVVRLRHGQSFRKNRRSFAWKCFVREQLLLDLAHLETPIQSTTIHFRAHTRKSTIHHLSRCHRRVSKHHNRIFGAFLLTNRHETFFWQIVWDPTRTNFVDSQMITQYY